MEKLSELTKEKIRIAAFKRGPISAEVRAKISANSTVCKTIHVFSFDRLPGGKEYLRSCRTLQEAALYCNCGEKTIRRALASKGVIFNKFYITRDLCVNK